MLDRPLGRPKSRRRSRPANDALDARAILLHLRLALVAVPLLSLLLATSACIALRRPAGTDTAAAATAPPAPIDARLIVRIADLTDCGGSGTACPEFTRARRLRI